MLLCRDAFDEGRWEEVTGMAEEAAVPGDELGIGCACRWASPAGPWWQRHEGTTQRRELSPTT